MSLVLPYNYPAMNFTTKLFHITTFAIIAVLALGLSTPSMAQIYVRTQEEVKQLLAARPAPKSQCKVTRHQIEASEQIIIMFEGGNGFTPEIETAFNKLVELRPEYYTQINGDRLEPRIGAGQYSIDLVTLQAYFYKQAGIKKFYLDYLISPLVPDLKAFKPLYFRSTDSCEEVYQCLNETRRDLPQAKVILMGFSHGGDRALQCAQYMAKEGSPATLGISFDPVPMDMPGMIFKNLLRKTTQDLLRGAGLNGYGTPDFDPYAPAHFTAPKETKWINFWQEDDQRLKVTGLTGFGVYGASYNKRVSIKGEAIEHAHWNIMNDSHVTEIVTKAIREVK